MAADVQIRFRAEGKQARSEIDQLKKEFADPPSTDGSDPTDRYPNSGECG